MRMVLVLIMALGIGQAWADDCGDLAKRFAADQNALKIGELDDLKSCIGEIEQAKAQAPDVPANKSSSDGTPAASQVSAADPVSLPVSP